MSQLTINTVGYKGVMTYTVGSGVSNNCGMGTITNINTSLSRVGGGGFGAAVTREETEQFWNHHFDTVVKHMESNNKSQLLLISDLMVYGGYDYIRSRGCYTSWFISELIRRQCGTVVASPIVTNYNYADHQHIIQAVFWRMPKFTTPIPKKHREAYEKCLSTPCPAPTEERLAAFAPAPPPAPAVAPPVTKVTTAPLPAGVRAAANRPGLLNVAVAVPVAATGRVPRKPREQLSAAQRAFDQLIRTHYSRELRW